MDEHKIKITSGGLWQNTHVMVGGKELRVSKMVISSDPSGYLKVKLTALVPELDIQALESHTQIWVHSIGGKDTKQ